ncbi:hypothetical protein EAG_11901, partial [Camponotus floridanus]
KGVIIGLTDKIFKLSNPRFHEKNFKLIIELLLDNCYPINFIFSTIINRIKSLIHNNLAPPLPPTSDTSKSFFVIPYIKGVSEHFKDVASNLNKSLAYAVPNKLNRFIKAHKDQLPRENLSNVIYKVPCCDCTASYVGQTGRQLKTRIKEHRSNVNGSSEQLSVVSLHRLEGHEFDWNEVIILDRESSFMRRSVSEMIHIIRQDNSLNVQRDTEKFDKIYL